MKDAKNIMIAVLASLVLYFVVCKCMENFTPFDRYSSKYENVNEPPKKYLNPSGKTVSKESGNGCGQDAMFISSNLLPKVEQSEENYFEGLNVPVDASNVELPLERQFYSTGSCRNANLNLRSEPPNPMKPISPWNISTITSCDSELRRPLEIADEQPMVN
tara:strand:- start:570 stop:1052 length:483 start_codon:yes stop_codon:yes gene_type:complete